MNLFTDLRGVVLAALDQMVQAGELPAGLDFANVTVEPPRDPAHGDMATNAAMVLAKPAGMKPREIADRLNISEHTARHHTERVLGKLGVRSRAAIPRAVSPLRSSGPFRGT